MGEGLQRMEREPRRRCGSSEASGLPPLTCATHGPGSISDATSAIARSGTQSRTSSAPCSREAIPRSARRARRTTHAAARTDDVDALDHFLGSSSSRIPGNRNDTGRSAGRAGLTREVPLQPRGQPLANLGPLVVHDRVPGAVAVLALADEHVLAVDALEARPSPPSHRVSARSARRSSARLAGSPRPRRHGGA